MAVATVKIMLAVLSCCTSCPFTLVVSVSAWGSAMLAAGTLLPANRCFFARVLLLTGQNIQNMLEYFILCIMFNMFVKGERTKRMNSMAQTGKGSINTPLTKLTIAEQVAAALRREIATGQLTAGTRLRQVEIAQRFEVSTTPVREAFGLLQSEGLVQIDPHRGVRVFLPTIQDLVEHYEIRMALEILAVEKAAERFQPQYAPPLVALLDEMHATSDAVRYVELNHEFHLSLYSHAVRSRLLTMIEELRNASISYNHLYAAADVPRDAERLDREHRGILAACQANDPLRAANAVRNHLQQTIVHVTKVLEQGGKV
jgi:DNA-binding GntR family transcriptional regulator